MRDSVKSTQPLDEKSQHVGGHHNGLDSSFPIQAQSEEKHPKPTRGGNYPGKTMLIT